MNERIAFLDYMRVIACLMVIMVHSCEFFFIDGSEIGIRSLNDGFWVSVIDSAFRCSVPLFVMISAYLLLPLKGSVTNFFKRRFSRVVIPFAIWSLLYAMLPYLWGAASGDDVLSSLLRLTYNFNDDSGHMWFVYMLIGLYLFIPILTPWLEQAGKRSVEIFIGLWFISTFFPYLRVFAGDIYGECYWNEYNMLWYFSGFIGYMVLGYYMHHYFAWSRKKQVFWGIILYLTGYYFTASIWYERIPVASTLQELELSWRFCTPNVVVLTTGAFLIIRGLFEKAGDNPVIRELSALSYGIYLMHIFVLGAVYKLFDGVLSTPMTILVVGVLTFGGCIIISRLLSKLPFGKWLIG